MIRLCLFDLDQTLVDTEDMKELRESGVRRSDVAYIRELKDVFGARDRRLIQAVTINQLCLNNPGMKIGIFTRAPRSYVETIATMAYPRIKWDTVVAYEDVQNVKPHRDGICKAMADVGLDIKYNLSEVLLVGDSDVDIRAAYHAGCAVALFKAGWPRQYQRTHWRSLELLPDAVVDNADELIEVFENPTRCLPDLECLLADATQAPAKPRFDKVIKFFPWGDDNRSPHAIYAAGRNFSGYESLGDRRDWHELSSSIQENKNSKLFPNEWILSLRQFIAHHYRFTAGSPFARELVVTAIPPRPGREPRLTHLLSQLKASYGADARVQRMPLSFESNILAYREGVRSHSREHLSADERFANVRDHLLVAEPASVKGRRFLVVDDVSTTGASLLYAKRYLDHAGASKVDCFTIAMNVGNPVRNA
jgi:phosphoglycolate phosphatase-like HAD superfamily hydrolase